MHLYLLYRPRGTSSFTSMLKDNESVVLTCIAGLGAASIVIFAYILWIKPRFLHMPIYETYDKIDGSSSGTEIV